jgi:hypothetical protein
MVSGRVKFNALTAFWGNKQKNSIYTHGGCFSRGFTRAAGWLPAGKKQDVLIMPALNPY